MIQQGRGLAAIGRARKAVVGALVTTLVAVPVALAVTPRHAEPGQRIDLKVLLVADSPSDSWTDNLQREGIPFDVVVASPTTHALTDDKLADYDANRAKYQAVIVDTATLGRRRRRAGQARIDVRDPPAEPRTSTPTRRTAWTPRSRAARRTAPPRR